mmetsp:Transcript_59864/g.142629  ORF Transcript_59864/g.142629 Transcript_59864/m.142629 type:complete len:222 (-) Transcript_59864:207-872(-)
MKCQVDWCQSTGSIAARCWCKFSAKSLRSKSSMCTQPPFRILSCRKASTSKTGFMTASKTQSSSISALQKVPSAAAAAAEYVDSHLPSLSAARIISTLLPLASLGRETMAAMPCSTSASLSSKALGPSLALAFINLTLASALEASVRQQTEYCAFRRLLSDKVCKANTSESGPQDLSYFSSFTVHIRKMLKDPFSWSAFGADKRSSSLVALPWNCAEHSST